MLLGVRNGPWMLLRDRNGPWMLLGGRNAGTNDVGEGVVSLKSA